ncbi:hypothetical protein C8F01DRAFT_1108362 [Mycena amicta]|nr:hypothetical protein C8F01DRAFT_1108362 [Mycena amicta]
MLRRPLFARRYVVPAIKKRAGSAIQEHLDNISQTSTSVVLHDLERLRPASHASPESPIYASEYTDLLQRLTSAFNADQLRQFLKLYNIPLPTDRKKGPLAIAIIEKQWNWPALAAIREQERAAELGAETLPLTPTQAFLILGKDGAESRALSHQHGVRFTFQSNPLSLHIEGTNGALQEVGKHITHLKASMVEEFFDLPPGTTTRADILNRISRLSGALVEAFGEGKVRISFLKHHSRTGLIVRRLLAQTLCEDSAPQNRRLFFHLPPSLPSSSSLPTSSAFPHDYALYPFLSPRFLPWTTSARGVYRIRRVEDWQGPGVSEDLKKTGGLAMGRGHLLNIHQQSVDLRGLLDASDATASRTIIASMGHFLLTSPPGEQFGLTPPLQGHRKISDILNWMETFSDPIVFAPTLPAPLLDEATSHKPLHRLLYRSINVEAGAPYNILKVEVVLPRSTGEAAANSGGMKELNSHCIAGRMMDLDVMIPDRPADIRFSALDSVPLAQHELPPQIGQYLADLRAFLAFENPEAPQPEPPVTLSYRGIMYLLQGSLNVRQKVEQGELPSLRMITESTVDLEGEQKTAARQVVYSGDPMDENGWKLFLASCDSMSTTPLMRKSSSALPM